MRRALFCIACIFVSNPAFAAAITNLSSVPQAIVIEGSEREIITIEPAQTYRTIGDSKISYHGQKISIDYDMEYVIWDDNVIGPQHRRAQHRY